MPFNLRNRPVLACLSILITSVLVVGIVISQVRYPVEDFSNDQAYPVLRIIDGDTVEINYDGQAVSVRLIGVDTPETVHPSQPVEAYGREASSFTKNLLLGESIYLRFDTENQDRYGRLLAYLYRAPDGLFVNLEVARQGYGHAYTQFPFKHMELFRHYENQARTAGKGLWGDAARIVELQVNERPSNTGQIEAIVYVTRTGKKYHLDGCRYLKSRRSIKLADARRLYQACRVCKPPQ